MTALRMAATETLNARRPASADFFDAVTTFDE
jgi:hypothetical protein